MVNGIDANRCKWAALSNQSADLGPSPESHENRETNQQPESTKTLKQAQDDVSPDDRCRVSKGSVDAKLVPTGETAFTERSIAS